MAEDLSSAARAGNRVSAESFKWLEAQLTPEQRSLVSAKAQLEGVSWLGVLAYWPSLFWEEAE